MAGWSRAKREAFESAFYTFLNSCFIDSKDYGRICLGEHLFLGQRMFITGVLDALEQDIHRIFCLKSRQLGLSTISRALSVFYLGVHNSLKGALLFDTAPHKDLARRELVQMIKGLPKKLKFPAVRGTGEGNRDSMELMNNSSILFLTGGVKKSKGSGTLGRSAGLSMAHLSELCSIDNPAGLEAFEQSLSEINPDRLYIYESTARGFNDWNTMWENAIKDPLHCKCIFLGWWSKDSQQIPKDHIDFAQYGGTPPSAKEAEKIKIVRERYGVEVTQEMLAWVRRKYDPTAVAEGDADPEYIASNERVQEQPWTSEESFQQTGSVFFPAEKLTEITHNYAEPNFKTFMFMTGAEFADMKVISAPNARNIDLKVWEEPDPDGIYCIGIDPAFGENPNNDRSSIQVLRCYADGVDQVAEYASPLPSTHQFAWVVASLLGYYGSNNAQVRYALELNGPGTAVFSELRSLKHQIETGYQGRSYEEKGLKDVFRNVRTYIYNRPDSLGVGKNFHLKCLATNTPIPTPFGWVTMAELQAGDKVFDEAGQPCTVLRVSDVKEMRKCYRVIFDDGSTIVADASHLWEVRGKHEKHDKVSRLVATDKLRVGEDFIPVTRPLILPDADLIIDPYILGVWLGDGYSESGRYCAALSDIAEMGRLLESRGAILGPIGTSHETVGYQNIQGLRGALRAANLCNNKHIPAQYLRASFAQRLALLQGLMDTDGTINPRNGRQCAFSTIRPALAAGFSELVRSLGIKAKCSIIKTTYAYGGQKRQGADAYFFNFTAYDDLPVFKLARKVERTKVVGAVRYRRSRRHAIVSVEQINSVPVKCIEVDSPSHLYLAGEAMVPTHNTTQQIKINLLERMRDFVINDKFRIRSIDLINEMASIAREGDSIKAPGSKKDDRVLAASFAVHCWETGPRKTLIQSNRTREAEIARKRLSIVDQVAMFNQNNMEQFFAQKRAVRVQQRQMAVRQSWRYR